MVIDHVIFHKTNFKIYIPKTYRRKIILKFVSQVYIVISFKTYIFSNVLTKLIRRKIVIMVLGELEGKLKRFLLYFPVLWQLSNFKNVCFS